MRRTNRIRWAVLATSLLLVVITASQWSLADRITPFGLVLLQLTVWPAFVASCIWSCTYLYRFRTNWRRSGVPLLVCAWALVVVSFFPFTKLWLDSRYAATKHEREQVVARILNDTLPSSPASRVIALAASDPNISSGGNEVTVERHDGQTFVLFYTYRGILDSYAGFLYVPAGGDPRDFADLSDVSRSEIVPYDPEWFFVSHH